MKECPKCHELNSEGARECFSCHEPFPDMANLPEKKICRQCGAVFSKNTVVCPNCQIQLSPYSSDIANAKPMKKKAKNKDLIIKLAIVSAVVFFIVLLPAMIIGTVGNNKKQTKYHTTEQPKTTESATTEVQKTEIITEPFISKPYTALNKVDSDKKLFSFNTKEFIDALSKIYTYDEDKELFVRDESSNYEQYKTLGGTIITVYYDSVTGNVTYINLLNNVISDKGSHDILNLLGCTLVVLDPTDSSLGGENLISALCLAENDHTSGNRLTNQVTNCGITFEMKLELNTYYDVYSFNIYPENFEYSELTTEPPTTEPPTTLSPDEIRKDFIKSCQTISYKKLARDPNDYKSLPVKFKGKVIQVMESGNTVALRVDVTKSKYGWKDTIYVTYERKTDNESRILEDDIINIYGIADGLKTYTAILGSDVTLPKIQAEYIDIVE